MTDITPIETHYRGYHFRSRIEARWAVAFDELKVRYEYEREGFEMGSDGRYLPDFWLPDRAMWVEIKGDIPTVMESGLCARLAELGHPVMMLWGNIGEHRGYAWRYKDSDLEAARAWWVDCPEHGVESSLVACRVAVETQRLHNAYIRARAARFEYNDKEPRFKHEP